MANNKDGFFAVNKARFENVLTLGMNAGISYLTIACGTSKSNTDSGWSINSIEKYTGVSRGRAKKAVEALIENNVIQRLKGGTKPRYRIIDARGAKKLEPKETYWLPNGVVMGVADELPPLARIRQSQDPMLLTLFVDLYSEQNLLEDGGVSQTVWRRLYSKEKINERAQYDVFGFTAKSSYVTWQSESTKKHFRKEEDLTEEEVENGCNSGIDFFTRMEALSGLGLLELTTHLFDNEDEGEIIHEMNDELDAAARSAAEALLSEQHETDYEFLIPLARHLKEATVVSTYRTIYKPRTNLTAGWHQESLKRNALYLDRYSEILDRYQ